MNRSETERRAANPSRWQEWREYLNAVCAISSWGLYGPRAWPIDAQATELLSRVMARPQRKPKLEDQAAKTVAAPTPALAGGCCGCAAG